MKIILPKDDDFDKNENFEYVFVINNKIQRLIIHEMN
jgi:hypothetical protein